MCANGAKQERNYPFMQIKISHQLKVMVLWLTSIALYFGFSQTVKLTERVVLVSKIFSSYESEYNIQNSHYLPVRCSYQANMQFKVCTSHTHTHRHTETRSNVCMALATKADLINEYICSICICTLAKLHRFHSLRQPFIPFPSPLPHFHYVFKVKAHDRNRWEH